jgi:hypothetical protein
MNARNDDVKFKEEGKNAVQNLTASLLGEAYLDLLEWDSVNPYPEVTISPTSINNKLFYIYIHSRTSNNGHCRGIQILSVIGGVR